MNCNFVSEYAYINYRLRAVQSAGNLLEPGKIRQYKD